MPRRKLYPMPVEALVDHPDFIAMPAAGAGIVIRLALHFWQTNTRPLPTADHELRAIGRAHAPTWRHWKTEALSVFEAIRPDLEAYWRLREAKGTSIKFVSSQGGAATRAKARQASLGQAALTDPPPSFATGTLPIREPALAKPRPHTHDAHPQRERMTERFAA